MIPILPFLNNRKDLDPSYKTDLDLWDCFRRKNLCLLTEKIRYLGHNDIVISFFTGSITVTFVIDGNTTDVNSTAYSLCESISNATTYTFDGYTLTLDQYMTIDNQTFYGVTCGVTVSFRLFRITSRLQIKGGY